MNTQWHLPCLLFGNFCCLLCAMEIQVNQSGLKLLCSGNTLLLCSSDVTPDCMDTSLCKTKREERQRNETMDMFKSLQEVLCKHSSSNSSLINRNSKEHFLELQNGTDILKLTDCWRYNVKPTNDTPELLCFAVLFLSIMIMFLSYICLKKTFTEYLSRKENTLLYVRPHQPNNLELL